MTDVIAIIAAVIIIVGLLTSDTRNHDGTIRIWHE